MKILSILCLAGGLCAQSLQVYAIDVEGGKSTLFVSPSGQSMLVDTGYEGHKGRDAARIVAAAKSAGQADRLPGDHALSSRSCGRRAERALTSK